MCDNSFNATKKFTETLAAPLYVICQHNCRSCVFSRRSGFHEQTFFRRRGAHCGKMIFVRELTFDIQRFNGGADIFLHETPVEIEGISTSSGNNSGNATAPYIMPPEGISVDKDTVKAGEGFSGSVDVSDGYGIFKDADETSVTLGSAVKDFDSTTLTGGDGSDTFIYSKGDGKEVIFGFGDADMLEIVGLNGAVTGKFNSAGTKLTVKVGSRAVAVLKDFTASTFNINGDTYRVDGKTLVK